MSASNRKKDTQASQGQNRQQSRKNQESGSKRGGGQRAQSRGGNGGQNRQQSQHEEVSQNQERRELEPQEVFEPVRGVRLATLRLARSWRYGGSPYAAMHAYERILAKYGGTPAAHAAAEELISMASELEREGKFYTALNIFNKIEEYCATEREEYYDPWRTAYVRPKRG